MALKLKLKFFKIKKAPTKIIFTGFIFSLNIHMKALSQYCFRSKDNNRVLVHDLASRNTARDWFYKLGQFLQNVEKV